MKKARKAINSIKKSDEKCDCNQKQMLRIHHVMRIDKANTLDENLDSQVYLLPANYKLLFGKTLHKDQKALPWKRGIIRICIGEHKVYRMFAGNSTKGIDQKTMGLSQATISILGLDKSDWGTQTSKSKTRIIADLRAASHWGKLMYYWQHPEHLFRVSIKVTVWFTVISIIMSIVLTFLSAYFSNSGERISQ